MCVLSLHPARMRAAGRLTGTQVLCSPTGHGGDLSVQHPLDGDPCVCKPWPGTDIPPLPWHTAHGSRQLFNKPLPDMRPPSTAGWTGGFY